MRMGDSGWLRNQNEVTERYFDALVVVQQQVEDNKNFPKISVGVLSWKLRAVLHLGVITFH